MTPLTMADLDGPCSRVSKMTPVFTGREPVFTGSVYGALLLTAENTTGVARRGGKTAPIRNRIWKDFDEDDDD